MATLLEIITEKNKRLDEIPIEFQGNVEKLQKRIANRIIELIGELETTGGQIKMSQKNLLIVQQIDEELRAILGSTEYKKAVTAFASEFDKQKIVNDEYFQKAFPDAFNETALANQLVKNAQRNAVNLLIGEPAETTFLTPIREQLEQSVASGASLKDTITGIREYVEGTPETDGRLLRYSKQVSFDSFAIADRSYTNALAEDIEAEWYLYSGGLIADSRCFCEERNGQYFHFKEIEAWGRMEDLGECNTGEGWAGMNKSTNEATIFLLAGGYNCRHSIQPVSIFITPPEVVQRNITNGNFELSDAAADALGI